MVFLVLFRFLPIGRPIATLGGFDWSI